MLLVIKEKETIQKIIKERTCLYFSENNPENKVNGDIAFVFDAEDLLNKEKARKIIRNIKKYRDRNVKIEFEYKNEKYNEIIINEKETPMEDTYYEDIDAAITAIGIKNRKERIEFCYDKSCEYLDNEFKKHNYCDFRNDVCIAKRERRKTRTNNGMLP